MSIRNQFLQHLAQTSNKPIGIEPAHAKGVYITDVNHKKYIDAISGFSVNNIGHGNEEVLQAIQKQAQQYMHLIVYGEYIQQPQVAYAKGLANVLPESLNCVYFTNSGTEATEGALKLSKRITNRSKIISATNAYHGSTQGALSVMGGDYWQQAYRPLLPNVFRYNINATEFLNAIDAQTACVIIEPVQAEAGIIPCNKEWLQQVRERCDKYCCLLIFDEIQSGFGRTGSLFAFEQMQVVPDILLLGKALGGGMPLGAFVANYKLMQTLTYNPVLGHITTFGGHPVSCAAGLAAFNVLQKSGWINEIAAKQKFVLQQLQHSSIQKINSYGLWFAVELTSKEATIKAAVNCVQNGVITDWFLFNEKCLRLAPPLSINYDELTEMIQIVLKSLE